MIKLQKNMIEIVAKESENLKSRFEGVLKSYLTGSLFTNPRFARQENI